MHLTSALRNLESPSFTISVTSCRVSVFPTDSRSKMWYEIRIRLFFILPGNSLESMKQSTMHFSLRNVGCTITVTWIRSRLKDQMCIDCVLCAQSRVLSLCVRVFSPRFCSLIKVDSSFGIRTLRATICPHFSIAQLMKLITCILWHWRELSQYLLRVYMLFVSVVVGQDKMIKNFGYACIGCVRIRRDIWLFLIL